MNNNPLFKAELDQEINAGRMSLARAQKRQNEWSQYRGVNPKAQGMLTGTAVSDSFGLSQPQAIDTVYNPIRTKLGWNFGSPNRVMARLVAARPALANAPGMIDIQNMIGGLQSSKKYFPELFGNQAGASVFPYLQMQLGNQQIDLPYQVSEGGVFKGMKAISVSRIINEGGASVSFSEHLNKKLADIPAGLSENRAGGWIRKTIQETLGAYGSTAMHGGRAHVSKMHWMGNKVTFTKGHEFSVRLQGIADQFGQISQNRVKGADVQDTFLRAQRRLNRLYEDVESQGLTVMGTKWDTMVGSGEKTARMMAFKKTFTMFPGMIAGDASKGFHQLAQRHLIPHGMMKARGFGRTVPFFQPRGYGNAVYDMPMNIGVLHPKLANRILGDSGVLLSSERSIAAVAAFPKTAAKTLHARLHGGDTIERAFSPMIEDLFRKHNIDQHFKTNNIFQFNKWIRLSGKKQAALGQGLGRSRTEAAAGIGEVIHAPKDMFLTGVKIRRRGRGIEYDFLMSKGTDVVDMSNVGLLSNTTRLSPQGYAEVQGTDILVGAQDYYKASLAKSADAAGFVNESETASLINRWMTVGGNEGANRTEMARILGLTPEMKNGQQTFTTGNQYVLTESRVSRLRDYIKTTSAASLASDARFFRTKAKMPTKQFNALMDRYGIHGTERAEYARMNRSRGLLSIMEGSSISHRNMLSGMKSQGGMKYRLDQMMSYMARGGEEYLASAEDLGTRLAGSRGGRILREVGGMYGSVVRGAEPQGLRTLTVQQYLSEYKAIPNLSGGVGPAQLKGTILEPGREAFWVQGIDGGDMPFYYGKDSELAVAGGANWSMERRALMPSAEAMGVAYDPGKGMYYGMAGGGKAHTPGQAALAFDELVRGDNRLVNNRALGLEMSAINAATKSSALGGKGMANPSIRPRHSKYSRLQYLPGLDDAHSIAVTEDSLRKTMTGRRVDAMIKRSKSSVGLFAEAVGWPAKEGRANMVGLKVRIMRAQEVAAMVGSTRMNYDNVVFAGAGVVGFSRRDYDLDPFAVHFNMRKGAQARMAKINAQESGWLKMLGEEFMQMNDGEGQGVYHKFRTTEDAVSLRKRFAARTAKDTTALHKVQYGSPYPEVFIRGRRKTAELMAMDSGSLKQFRNLVGRRTSAAAELKAAGMGELVGKGMSRIQYESMDAFLAGWSQLATGKKKELAFALPEALQTFSQTGRVQPIKAALEGILAADPTNIMPVQGLANRGAMIGPAVEAMTKVESGFSGMGNVQTPWGAMYGRSGDKAPSVVANFLGATYDPTVGGQTQGELGQILAGRRGVEQAVERDATQAMINQEIKNTARGRRRTSLKGAIGGLRNLWSSGWGGKAVIIAGAAMGMKGLADAFSPTSDMSASEAPLPPDIRLPQRSMPPQFAIPMADTRVGRPNTSSYSADATIQGAYFSPEGMMDHLQTNILGAQSAFGSFSVQNTPMTESEMEYLLRDKMRSDF